jgi:HSP20 family molecular chaperone IbpA
MDCPRCGSKIEKDWDYCPRCGTPFRQRDVFSLFDMGKIFERLGKVQEEMKKSIEKDFEVFDLTPAFKKAKSSGFTIRITSSGDSTPKVYVKTFGDVDEKAVRREVGEMAEQTGMKLKQSHKPAEKELPIPKYTEEPKTSVRRADSGVVVEIEMPGVRSEEDIRINELESSVEVRAIAGDKAYFKILTKPEQFTITEKEFRNGKLVIVFS